MTFLISCVLGYPLHMGGQNTRSSSMYEGLGADPKHPNTPVMGIYSLGRSPSSRQGQMIGSEPPGRMGGFKADVCGNMKNYCWCRIRDTFFSPNTSGQMGLKSSGVLWDHLNRVCTVVFSTWFAKLDVSINADASEMAAPGTLLKPAVESAYTDAKWTLIPSTGCGLLTSQIF